MGEGGLISGHVKGDVRCWCMIYDGISAGWDYCTPLMRRGELVRMLFSCTNSTTMALEA